MKIGIIALGLIVSASAMAAKNCKVSSVAFSSGFPTCTEYSTRFEVQTEEECRSLAQSARENRFFGLIAPKERVIKTKMVYRGEGVKLTERFPYEDHRVLCYY